MRSEFLEVATLEQANKLAPWAAEIVPADGGFHAFESIDDYNRWLVETDYELADIDLPGGQGESVLLTEGGVVSGAGKVYGVFADLADATAENADELVLATIGENKLTEGQKAIASRNSDRIALKSNAIDYRRDVVRAVEEANVCNPEEVCDLVLRAWNNGDDWKAVLAEAVANDAHVAKQLGVE